MFINSANRTGDGGASTATIRNDNGPTRFGYSGQNTTLTGYRIFTETRKFYPKNISSYYHTTGTLNSVVNYDLQFNVDFRTRDTNSQTTVHEGFFLITVERRDTNPWQRAMGHCYLYNGNFYDVTTFTGSSTNNVSFSQVTGPSSAGGYERLRVVNIGHAQFGTTYEIELIGLGGQAISEGTY